MRDLPSIDRLLGDARVVPLLNQHPRPVVLRALRAAVSSARQRLSAQKSDETDASRLTASIVAEATRSLAHAPLHRMRHVINATGVVLHTNLGRSLLCSDAIEAIKRVAGAYTNLEFDLESGARGQRGSAALPLLAQLSGAESACIVNNNAAAVLLILDTFARGREVVVARSELIEIGGSFRLPEVLEKSGATLREVGATNRVYPNDFERSITDRTALLLKSHPSNYRIVGFTREVSGKELVAIGRSRGVPTVMDLGSGLLVDLQKWGLPEEPTVPACIRDGFDLVCFSADKLLGGPQAGIIAGRRDAVARCAANPLARALRCGKLDLAALEATLAVYLDPARIPLDIPVLRMLTRSSADLEDHARRLASRLEAVLDGHASVTANPGTSTAGGGSFPCLELASWQVNIAPRRDSPSHWADRLRGGRQPVVVRTVDEHLALDVRTLQDDDTENLIAAFANLAKESSR